MRYAIIDIDTITANIQIRKLSPKGIKRLKASIQERGYLSRYPLAVAPIDGTGEYKLLDGHHRLEALRQLGQTQAPAQVFDGLTADEEYRLAYESNRGQDAIVPQDWTDDAEFIWSLAAQGKTQTQIGEIMRWNRSLIAQYAQHRNISPDVWQLIVVTTKGEFVTRQEDDDVTAKVTTVTTFTEGLCRSIDPLTPAQQLSLVKDLAAGRTTKDKFRAQAERFKHRNDLGAEATRRLAHLPPEYAERALMEIATGNYDRASQADFDKLIQQMLDEYANADDYPVICADIRTGLPQLADESFDVIVTDPPYPREYLPLYEDLAKLAARVLAPGGSLFVMCGQSYLPEVLNLMTPYLTYHWTISYQTPGGQAVQIWNRNINTFWKPVLWFQKGEYTGKWSGDVVSSAINDNDKRYHGWGQSESGMADLIKHVTRTGQHILDPFCGAGTTAVVAKQLGRKCTSVDIAQECVDKTSERLQEVRGSTDES